VEQHNNAGRWQGEIWDRKKNGELYAKWSTISVLRHPDGSIYRHVAQFSDITEKKTKDELIQKHANFDLLTELPNRRLFYDRLEQEILKSRRSGKPLALLLIDLDRFKEVNDTLGHAKGDVLLVEAARRIRQCVRQSDTVARLGGDEFTVILPELSDLHRPETIAESIIRSLGQPFPLGGEDVGYVSASVGLTVFPEEAQDIEGLLPACRPGNVRGKERRTGPL